MKVLPPLPFGGRPSYWRGRHSMTQDIEFRNRLREMLDSDSDEYVQNDAEIIKYVLNHAKNQWSASLVRWWYEEGRDYADNFVD